MFDSREDLTEMKMVVHGYLGYKASKEMEQFLTVGELRRIAHYEDGVWIAQRVVHSKVTYLMYFRRSRT